MECLGVKNSFSFHLLVLELELTCLLKTILMISFFNWLFLLRLFLFPECKEGIMPQDNGTRRNVWKVDNMIYIRSHSDEVKNCISRSRFEFCFSPFYFKIEVRCWTLDINILYNEFLHSLWLVTAASWK